ncbi:MAG TPA: serine hydrolase [Longimicrobiales bacterium]|nr:serine hydrolase [Longimicrobiales bacterium]
MPTTLHRLGAGLLALGLLFPGAADAQQTPLGSSAPFATGAPSTPAAIDWAALDAYIDKALKDWEVPGLALAVVKGDSVVYAKGYGVKELGKPDPITPRTLFAVASTSKAFTAALMAMLVDSGKVKWDDHVIEYLPQFQLYDPYVTREMTIRDLLTHRSGLSRGDRVWYASDLDRDQVIHQMKYLKPSWGFRSNFGYQNVMFVTATQLEAKVTGKSWDELVRERLFQPLGMTGTVTSVRDLAGKPDVATPHDKVDDKVVPIHWVNVDNIGGAGAINSSALDMAQWVRLQLGKGEFGGKRLVGEKTMRDMHQPQMLLSISDRAEKLNPDVHFSAYGLGWFLLDYRGRKVVHHGGNLDGFSAEVFLVPEEKLGIVILTNMDGTQLRDALPFWITDRFLGGRDKDWSAEYLKFRQENQARADSARLKVEAARVKGTKPSLPLHKYAGVYTDSLYGKVSVALENGHLVATSGPAFVADLEHWHYDTFRAVFRNHAYGKTYMTFAVDKMGQVGALDVDDFAVFARVPEKDKDKKVATGTH